MIGSVIAAAARRSSYLVRLADYAELTKPRILLLVLITVAVSASTAAQGRLELVTLAHVLAGTALVAASASAMNQWLERSADARMERTRLRPLPSGRLVPFEALAFGWLTLAAGLAWLVATAPWQTACWALATWLLYVWVYTPLKQRTPLNTLAGSVPGAMPVLIGWSAAGQPWDAKILILMLVVVCWQFPHFMAIAWLYRHQYAAAGMRMWTVVEPAGRRAATYSLAAATLLLAIAWIPAGVSASVRSWPYALVALLLGSYLWWAAARFWRDRTDATARRLLHASLVYLPGLLMALTLFVGKS